jgi:16S rRNA (uracil1498-N3)-methyltransferase
MGIRLFVDSTLTEGNELALPPAAARHAQVRRVQPGDRLTLFDGAGSDWPATVLAMGRSEVLVRLGAPQAVHHELPLAITLALGMPANDRMDMVVEKATELGAVGIQALHTERSVLRLHGERGLRKQAHWLGIAQAACEQSGRARVPQVAPVLALPDWLAQLQAGDAGKGLDAANRRAADAMPSSAALRLVLSLRADAKPLAGLADWAAPPRAASVVFLSGPEGGLSSAEEDAARLQGFVPVSLGARVVRADTAPLAALAWLGLHAHATLTPRTDSARLEPKAG